MNTKATSALPGALLAIVLASCGGGGGGGSTPVRVTTPPPAPPPSTAQAPVYTPNVFEPARVFKNRCEVVRTGVDLEGNPYPDRAGSELIEKFWLRSWTEETYLWRDEVTDRDPNDFDDRLSYFDILRTFAITPSGEDKDDFHFSQPTEEFLEERNSAPRAGYGVSFTVARDTPPRDFRVRYVDPGTPAAQVQNGVQNFQRGERIIAIDGADFITGDDIDRLNDGLFPKAAGEVHSFVLRAPDGTERTVDITAADVTRKPVNRTRIIDTDSGRVGYILFNTFSPFSSEKEIADAMEAMRTAGISDLVLDLRYNGGGLLAVASQLAYMVAGDTATGGQVFEQLRFNSGLGGFNPVTGEFNQPIPFLDTGLGFSVPDGTPLPALDLNRVYILTTQSTCSASEAVINGLRGIDIEVVLVGNTTCGKPFGFYPQDNCGETYYTIQFQGVNDKGFGDYADGFLADNAADRFGVRLPGCYAEDDLTSALGDENEALLAAALSYRANGTCPPRPAVVSSFASAKTGPGLGRDEGLALGSREGLMDRNRDMRMPGDRE